MTIRSPVSLVIVAIFSRINMFPKNQEESFEQIAAKLRLDVNDIHNFDVVGQKALLDTAGNLVRDVVNGYSDALPALAEAVLDRLAAQQSAGSRLDYSHRDFLQLYRQLPVLTADSPQQFWQRLNNLPDRADLTTEVTSRLYEQWRRRHVTTNRRRSRERALASPTAARISNTTPSDFAFEVAAGEATIRYDSADELLRDMWGYFVPSLGSAHSIGQQERAKLLDSSGAASDLDTLNQGWDAKNMRRLEEEIREWAQGSRAEPYVDPEARHGGTPYEYGPGLFSEHGIVVDRTKDGRLGLQFVGGGYGADGVELAQRFSAFTGRAITYSGPVGLTYTLRPPTNITELPLQEASYWTDKTLGDLEVPVPIDQIANHLSSISNTSISPPAPSGSHSMRTRTSVGSPPSYLRFA